MNCFADFIERERTLIEERNKNNTKLVGTLYTLEESRNLSKEERHELEQRVESYRATEEKIVSEIKTVRKSIKNYIIRILEQY